MHKLLSKIGFVLLIIISFIITDYTVHIVLNNDELMMTIKEVSSTYSSEAFDGVINGDYFIPGISGTQVNVTKSYNNMKKYGIFIESMLEYNEIKPQNKLKDNYNKYIISGNENKKIVSLIFLIHSEDDVFKIIDVLDSKDVKVNFFIDGYWFEKNKGKIYDITKLGHVIGNLSYNGNYDDGAYIWMDTVIKKVGKQSTGYCYTEKDNLEILNICALNKNYTILPQLVLKDNFFKNIKTNIKNGMIISLDVNNELINELVVIINYIKSKGYEINNLNVLLSESY